MKNSNFLLLTFLISSAFAQTWTTIWGTNNYIEYRFPPNPPPIILAVPHGGTLEPADIANRTLTPLIPDQNTTELAYTVAQRIYDVTGRYPPMVICHLRRNKLDANRDLAEAAQGDPQAGTAWAEYHGFLQNATDTISQMWSYGHFFDIHGHQHNNTWVEVGLNVNISNLNLNDTLLNSLSILNKASIRTLALQYGVDNFASLVRGNWSIGGLLNSKGYPSVPGPQNPGPGSADYFDGGYSVETHGSMSGGLIDATQIETHRDYRIDSTIRTAYATDLADIILAFMAHWYNFDNMDPSASPTPSVTPTITPSNTPSRTPSKSPSPSRSPSKSATPTRTPSRTPSSSSSPAFKKLVLKNPSQENKTAIPQQALIGAVVGGVALVAMVAVVALIHSRRQEQPSVEVQWS